MNNTEAIIKSSYDAKLTNQDLAPLKKQTWGAYNIFAFWMSDVHSVGGYVMAGSLFALGLNSWQVLLSLLIGIAIVQFFTNLIAKSSHKLARLILLFAAQPSVCLVQIFLQLFVGLLQSHGMAFKPIWPQVHSY